MEDNTLRYKGHKADFAKGVCDYCKAILEQIEDGISCGPVRCKECTLMRVCYGDTCEECLENIAKKGRDALKASMTQVAQKTLEEYIAKVYRGAIDKQIEDILYKGLSGVR